MIASIEKLLRDAYAEQASVTVSTHSGSLFGRVVDVEPLTSSVPLRSVTLAYEGLNPLANDGRMWERLIVIDATSIHALDVIVGEAAPPEPGAESAPPFAAEAIPSVPAEHVQHWLNALEAIGYHDTGRAGEIAIEALQTTGVWQLQLRPEVASVGEVAASGNGAMSVSAEVIPPEEPS